MSSFSVDAVVIGSGVVGLAIARKLAQAGFDTIILEAADAIGTGTSSRNSEVIHAGLYYPTGSLKAKSCVAGREMLYAYCAEKHVPFKACGKLLVATDESQLEKLASIERQALHNAVPGLTRLTPEEVTILEPEVRCVAALLSSRTGIIDSHAFMLALQADFENAGGMIAFQTPVIAGDINQDGIFLETGGKEPATIHPRYVINAAGHGAPKLLYTLDKFPQEYIPQQWYAKGNYFSLLGHQPFSRLVYPMPDAAGLGTHATIDLAGRCRFGPDVEWVADENDLFVKPDRSYVFYDAIRSYWPHLPDHALQPDYAGIRPKLHGPGMPMPDFRLDGPAVHGIGGLVNLFGIESPGLTASLALADTVMNLLGLE